MTKIWIDAEEYELESLPEAVRDEFVSLHFVQNELNKLEMMRAALKNSERIYSEALNDAVMKWKNKKRSDQHQE